MSSSNQQVPQPQSDLDKEYAKMLEDCAAEDSKYLKAKVPNPDERFDKPRDDNGEPKR